MCDISLMNASYAWIVVLIFFLTWSGRSMQLKSTIRFVNFSQKYISYNDAWELQRKVADYHISQQDAMTTVDSSSYNYVGTVLCLQHPHVYTLGTATTENSGPFGQLDAEGKSLDFETITVDRAGQATYHGPGQLIFYPIIDLNYFQKDINFYLRNLEKIVITLVSQYGIEASLQPGLTGVWVGDAKIAAIGVKIQRWVTMHGVSINVNPEMRYFKNIVPCGISDKAVGALVDYNPTVTLEQVAKDLQSALETCFGVACQSVDTEQFLQSIDRQETS